MITDAEITERLAISLFITDGQQFPHYTGWEEAPERKKDSYRATARPLVAVVRQMVKEILDTYQEEDRIPYVGDGVAGCLASAAIDMTEAEQYPTGSEDWQRCIGSATRWNRQAARLTPDPVSDVPPEFEDPTYGRPA